MLIIYYDKHGNRDGGLYGKVLSLFYRWGEKTYRGKKTFSGIWWDFEKSNRGEIDTRKYSLINSKLKILWTYILK